VIDNRTVITGSFNWSPSAAHQNDEVLLVIESLLLAAHFTREMDRLWRGAELGINGRLARKLAANRRRCGSGVRRGGRKGLRGNGRGVKWLGEWLLFSPPLLRADLGVTSHIQNQLCRLVTGTGMGGVTFILRGAILPLNTSTLEQTQSFIVLSRSDGSLISPPQFCKR